MYDFDDCDRFDGRDEFDYCGEQADQAPCPVCTDDSTCDDCAEAIKWLADFEACNDCNDSEVPF